MFPKAADIWIVGAGGVGCALGARLAVAFPGRVLFIDEWRDHVDALTRDGLSVSYRGELVHASVRAIHLDDLDEKAEPPAFVVLAVKTFDTERTVTAIAPYIGEAPIVSLQNSLNETTISSIIGERRTVGAVCLFDGSLVGPGTALQDRPADKMVIGDLGGVTLPRTEAIAEVLSASVPVEITDNIWGELWTKLILNSMLNGLSSITDLGLGDMVRLPGCVEIAVGVAVESVPVALSLGYRIRTEDLIDCGFDYPVDWFLEPRDSVERKQLQDAFYANYEHTRHVKPSMLQDMRKGRPTEISWMNGLIVDAAASIGRAAPLNARIVELVREREAGRTARAERDVHDLLAHVR